jgi:hypothetical protein
MESLMSVGLFYIIGMDTLLDKVITQEFIANYPYLSAIHILLVYMGIAMLMVNTIIAKKESTSLRYKIKKILEVLGYIYNNFKKYPLAWIQIAILIIGSLMFINIMCNWLGVTVCFENYLSYYITLFSKLVFIKLIISLILLPLIKNQCDLYKIIGMSVYLPLAVLPSSFIYYNYFLPELVYLKFIVDDHISSMLGIVKNWLINIKLIVIYIIHLKLGYLQEWWLELNLKNFFIILLKIGQSLGGNFRFMNITPGTCLVRYAEYRLSEYGLDTKPKATRLKSFFNKARGKIIILSPGRALYIANVRYFNFIKYMPRLPLIRITPIPSSRDNASHLIYVKGYLNDFVTLMDIYLKKSMNKCQLLNITEHLGNVNVKIHLYNLNLIIEQNSEKKMLGINITDSKGKAWDINFDPKEFIKGFLTNIIKVRVF